MSKFIMVISICSSLWAVYSILDLDKFTKALEQRSTSNAKAPSSLKEMEEGSVSATHEQIEAGIDDQMKAEALRLSTASESERAAAEEKHKWMLEHPDLALAEEQGKFNNQLKDVAAKIEKTSGGQLKYDLSELNSPKNDDSRDPAASN